MTALWKRDPVQLPVAASVARGRPIGECVVGRFLGTVIVTLHGPVDVPGAARLGNVLRDVVDGQGNLAVIVDLRDVPTIHPAGIDVLATAADSVAGRGGELRLGGPSGQVFDAITLGGLARLVSVPFEEAHRAWVPPGRVRSSERTGRASHPARRRPHEGVRRDQP